MRGEQVWQVLRTYTTRWWCWLILALWLFLQILLLRTAPEPSDSDQELGRFMLMPLVQDLVLAQVLGVMLRLQFANPRARLLPGFVTPHFVVAVAMVVVAALIQGVSIGWGLPFGSHLAMGCLAFLVIATALLLSSVTTKAGGVALMYFLLPLSSFAPQWFGGFVRVLIGNPILSLGLGCLGLAVLRDLHRRLSEFSEDAPAYSRPEKSPGEFASQAEVRNREREKAKSAGRSPIITRLRDAQFALLFRRGAARHPWERVVRGLFARGFLGFKAMLLMLAVAIGVFVMFLIEGDNPSSRPEAWIYSLYLSFLPTLLILGILPISLWQIRTYLATESLRPLGRRDFVRDLFRCAGCDMAAPAFAQCMAIALYWSVMPLPKSPSGLLLPWIVLTITTYVLGYCFLLWVASYREVFLVVLGVGWFGVVSAAVIHSAVFGEHPHRSPLGLVPVVVVIAVAAVLMYRTAFRRWCHVDLA